MPKSKSIMNDKYEFDEDQFVVSVFNKGDKLTGHAVILVEGILKKPGEMYAKCFIGQYDITAERYATQDNSINIKGEITQVRCHEGETYHIDYSLYPSQSYICSPNKVWAMIASIKADKRQCENANQGKGKYPQYQLLGKNHPFVTWFGNPNDGDNCAGWCISKLKIVGLEGDDIKPKPNALTRNRLKVQKAGEQKNNVNDTIHQLPQRARL